MAQGGIDPEQDPIRWELIEGTGHVHAADWRKVGELEKT